MSPFLGHDLHSIPRNVLETNEEVSGFLALPEIWEKSWKILDSPPKNKKNKIERFQRFICAIWDKNEKEDYGQN